MGGSLLSAFFILVIAWWSYCNFLIFSVRALVFYFGASWIDPSSFSSLYSTEYTPGQSWPSYDATSASLLEFWFSLEACPWPVKFLSLLFGVLTEICKITPTLNVPFVFPESTTLPPPLFTCICITILSLGAQIIFKCFHWPLRICHSGIGG